MSDRRSVISKDYGKDLTAKDAEEIARGSNGLTLIRADFYYQMKRVKTLNSYN